MIDFPLDIGEDFAKHLREGYDKCPWIIAGKPFYFPRKPLRDVCFVWPLPGPTKLGNKGIIEIPEIYRKYYRKNYGVLLAIGPGFYKDSGKWVPTKLSPNTLVMYDGDVPWFDFVTGPDGSEYFVNMCGEQDVKGVFQWQ
jgi:hypothetical protein